MSHGTALADLCLLIAPSGGGDDRLCVTLTSSGRDGATKIACATIDPPAFDRWEATYQEPLAGFAHRPVDDSLLEAFGNELADALLPVGLVRSRFLDAVNGALAGGAPAVRVGLAFDAPHLIDLPWEFARLPHPVGFLGLLPRLHLVRRSAPPRPDAPPITNERLRVLLVWADPNTATFPTLPHLSAEVQSVLAALRAPECRERLVVDELPCASPTSLQRCLAEKRPHVLHFIGHGDQRASGGLLVLHGDTRRSERVVYGDELTGWLLPAPTLRLAVLSACRTAGVAEALVHGGVGAVLAHQLSLRDAAAAPFARAFYGALVQPCSVEEALAQARQMVRGAGPDWGAPVLHLGTTTGDLFHPTGRVAPAAPPPFSVPFARNPDFVGREETLAALHDALAGPRAQPVALVGIGGLGKTQLAVEYAHRQRSAYGGGVFWIDARDTLHVKDAYGALGRFFDVPPGLPADERVDRVRDALQRVDRPALLVFDNVSPETDLKLLPSVGEARLLVTTREGYLVRQNFRALATPLLDEAAALALLSTQRPLAGGDERAAARQIAATLGHLPLALALVAHHVARLDTTFVAYEKLLTDNVIGVLEQARKRFITTTEHNGRIYDALDVSYKSLDSGAQMVLRVASCLAGRGIPSDLLFAASPIELRADFDEALADLRDTSLVTRDGDGRLSLHELVRVFAREQSDEPERRAHAQRVAALLTGRLAAANNALDWRAVRAEIPHHYAAAQACRHAWANAPLCDLLRELGAYLLHHGEVQSAARHLEEGLALVAARHGRPDHGDAAPFLVRLGEARIALRDYPGALSAVSEALVIAQSSLGDADPEIAHYYLSVGAVLKMGFQMNLNADLNAALGFYRRALEILETAHGRQHHLVAVCLNNLGTALETAGDHDGALAHLSEALAIDEALVGRTSAAVAPRLNNMGRVLGGKGAWQSALALHEEALAIYENTYTRRHTDVAASLYYVAEARRALGETNTARMAFSESLATFEHFFGPDHRTCATVRDRLAALGEKEQ